MPWVMRKNDSGEICVFKEGADGQPTGDSLGCHATEDEAKQQMAALYAATSAESKSSRDASQYGQPLAPQTDSIVDVKKAVKFIDGKDDEVEGLLLPYGGIHNGRDLDGQFFSKKTDFCLDWFPAERPALYHHGMDEDAGTSVVGRVKSIEMRDDGGWMRAQLDKRHKYFGAISEMVKKGELSLSSGAMAHLVKVEKSGEILRWPVVEGSLTPTPSNLLATVDLATAEKHYKSAGLEIPDAVRAAPEQVQPEQPVETKATDLDSISIVDHAILTAHYAASLSQRTKDLRERRTKEGRVISSMNRKRLSECVTSMRTAMEDLQGLLDSTEPQPAKAASVWRQLRARNIDAFASQLSGTA